MSLRVGGLGARMCTSIPFRSRASSSSCLIVSVMSLSVSDEAKVGRVGELKGVASRPRASQESDRLIGLVGLAGLGSKITSVNPE